MTDPVEPLPEPNPNRGGAGPRWMRWLLVASLALNLAVLGVMGGAALRFRGGGPHVMAVRDLTFGPFTEALSPPDRETLRREFMGEPGAFQAERHEARSDLEQILTALRAEPFDPGRIRSGLDRQKARLETRMDLGQGLLADLIARMPVEERLKFADRLQGVLEHQPELRRPPPTEP